MIVGIDPGLTGALAILPGGTQPAIVHSVPTYLEYRRVRAKRGKHAGQMVDRPVTRYDLVAMSDLLDDAQRHAVPNELVVGIEAQNPRPAEGISGKGEHGDRPGQGVVTAGKVMYGYGIWVGLCYGKGIVPLIVWPHVWKRTYPQLKGAGKGAARLLAKDLWPHLVGSLSRVKDDGRAEALLIAEWVRLHGSIRSGSSP